MRPDTVQEGPIDLTPSPHPENFPPPSVLLLKIHASVSMILHLSGQGDKYRHYWEEFDVSSGLRENGEDYVLLQMAVVVALERRYDLEGEEFRGDDSVESYDVGLQDVKAEESEEENWDYCHDGEPPTPPPSPSEELFGLPYD
jgi:hypothetical protein